MLTAFGSTVNSVYQNKDYHQIIRLLVDSIGKTNPFNWWHTIRKLVFCKFLIKKRQRIGADKVEPMSPRTAVKSSSTELHHGRFKIFVFIYQFFENEVEGSIKILSYFLLSNFKNKFAK